MTQIVYQEVARWKSLLSAKKKKKFSGAVWLAQGLDARTGASLPPILNEEGRITGATDLRKSYVTKSNIFQVNNTSTTISNSCNVADSNHGLACRGLSSDACINSVQLLPNTEVARSSAGVDCMNGVEEQNEEKLFIPLNPIFIASMIRHWIAPSPSEGLSKPLVDFSLRDRNSRIQKPSLKKLFDKRKAVSMAFLLYVDEHGVDAYEKAFWPLNSKFCAGKALEASRKYINDECKRRESLKKFLRDEVKVREFTNRVMAKLDLKKVVEQSLSKT